MANPPPAPAPKKSGLGCFGLGCLILLLLLVLFLTLVGGTGYYLYTLGLDYTSTQAAVIQSYDGGDDMYAATKQKLTDFHQSVLQHQPTTLHLNADEINTYIARDPAFAAMKGHAYVILKGDQAELQASIPISTLEKFAYAGRYVNLDTTFTVGFNPDTKDLQFVFQKINVNDHDFSQRFYDGFNGTFGSSFNQQFKLFPGVMDFLNQTQNIITVENSELVIETK